MSTKSGRRRIEIDGGVMGRLIRFLAASVVSGAGNQVFAQDTPPPCPEPYSIATWNDCIGTIVHPSGEKYVGTFKEGKFHGIGTLTRSTGETQIGSWRHGNYIGPLQLQAPIARQLREYQSRGPRTRHIVDGRAMEYRFAKYEEDWRSKIEREGTRHYPDEARGKWYGNLRLAVTIRPDGSVESVVLDRSSSFKVLDRAALRIVQLAAPFAAFPPEIRKDTDLLVITRTWFFGQGDKFWTE